MSKRAEILDALIQRVTAIRVADGFTTDAGDNVYLGETPELSGADEVSAVAIVPQDDTLTPAGSVAFMIEWPIEIQALIGVDPPTVESWATLEGLLGDIKRAIELSSDSEHNLDGLVHKAFTRGSTRTLERETGTRTFGLSITYTFTLKEGWGTP